MHRFSCKYHVLILLLLLLSACSSVPVSPSSSLQTDTHLTAFQNESKFYGLNEVSKAITSRQLGARAVEALVPLFFNDAGKLMKGSELGGFVRAKAAATPQELSDLQSLRTFLKRNGLNVYFTDFNTFQRVMTTLSGRNALSLNDYASLRSEHSVAHRLSGHSIYTFIPYVTEDTLKQMRDQANKSVVLSQQASCQPPDTVETTSLAAKYGQLNNLTIWHISADYPVQPSQNIACLAACNASYASALVGCAFIPIPGSLICATAASIALGFCFAACG